MGESDNRSGRDTRLLALVIVISLAVLFGLARFRFPAADLTTAPTVPGPLERLVARATYEDLAANVSSVLQRASSSVVVFQLDPVPSAETAAGEAPRRGALGSVPVPSPRLMAGLRLGGDLAMVYLPVGYVVTGATGYPSVELVGADAARAVALVRLPATADPVDAPSPATGFAGFGYVAVIEGAVGGPTAKPVFVGRVDTVTDGGWGADLLAMGGSPEAPVGSLVFSLDGRFVGLAVPTAGNGRALASLTLLAAAASALTGPGEGLGP